MKKMFLETSVIRALSFNKLNQLNKKFKLFVSPYSFWEILCHLDEDFNKFKIILLKFDLCKILNDPYLWYDYIQKIDDNTIEIVKSLIKVLKQSDSIDSFYSKKIKTLDGILRTCNNCCSRVRKKLKEQEERFLKLMTGKIIELYKNNLHDIPKTYIEKHSAILSLIKGQIIKAYDGKKPSKDNRKELQIRYYFYCAYILFRSIKKIKSGSNVKVNDFEDASIVLHLNLKESYVFITSDNGLFITLNKIIKLIKDIKIKKIQTNLQIKKINYLNQFIGA